MVYFEVVQQYVVSNSSEFVVAYINILNFVFSIGVVLFIINGNYRDYYYKKNIVLQKALIFTMANLVESRDENTGGHIQRTSRYVEIIAEKLKKDEKYKKILTDEYVEDMVIAAPLHDVGKIHISDAILNKPGKLDDEEFSIIEEEKGSHFDCDVANAFIDSREAIEEYIAIDNDKVVV